MPRRDSVARRALYDSADFLPTQEARATPERARCTLEAKHPDAGLEIARAHDWRGEAREALDWLERADAAGQPLAEGFTYDPFLRAQRGEPRYTALLRKLNLPVD